MGMDPSDETFVPFYNKIKELDMVYNNMNTQSHLLITDSDYACSWW